MDCFVGVEGLGQQILVGPFITDQAFVGFNFKVDLGIGSRIATATGWQPRVAVVGFDLGFAGLTFAVTNHLQRLHSIRTFATIAAVVATATYEVGTYLGSAFQSRSSRSSFTFPFLLVLWQPCFPRYNSQHNYGAPCTFSPAIHKDQTQAFGHRFADLKSRTASQLAQFHEVKQYQVN